MKVIILPGYSAHNKEWAKSICANLGSGHICIVHEWGHWIGGSFSLKNEVDNIMEEIGGDKVNIIAKSVGTRVTMNLIPKIINRLDKVILCGIPTKFESEPVRTLYRDNLKKLGSQNVICIQNTRDPFSPFARVKEFVNSVDAKIKVIEKPRTDHEYPYYEDFKAFLAPK